jgi:3-methyladenine DNA glycosylase Tag
MSEPTERGVTRCEWAHGGGAAIGTRYLDYHDEVWGVPERDPQVLFEFLILEGAQAGLSWSTILNKIDGYRRAFAGFDPAETTPWMLFEEDRCRALECILGCANDGIPRHARPGVALL